MFKREDELIVALLMNRSVKEASAAVGLSERTVHRRLADPAFQQKLNEASAHLLGFSLAFLPSLVESAVHTVGASLKSTDERLRLRAAEIVLSQAFRHISTIEFDKRLRQVEVIAEALLATKGPNRG